MTAISLIVFAGSLHAQDPKPVDAPKPNMGAGLGVRQQQVRRMLGDLDRRITEVARKLESEQPGQSRKLIAALEKSKRLLLDRRMNEIVGLLNDAKLDSASDEQLKLNRDLTALIEFLLHEDEESERVRKEIETLQEWKKEIEKILGREKDLLRDSQALQNKPGAMEKLDARIEDLEKLIEKQEALLERTAGDEEKGLDALDRLAADQAALRKETSKLASELAAEPAQPPPGAESLQNAAGKQKDAEKSLGKRDPEAAAKSEQAAVDRMREALQELKNERERVEKLGEESMPGLSRSQKENEGRTGELGRQMAQSEHTQESQQAENARQALGKAGKSMGQASEQLDQQQPGEAAEDQEDAVEELEDALGELEERLDELKKEVRNENLAKLENQFREMLERQKAASKLTTQVDPTVEDPPTRAQRLAIRKIARMEEELAGSAEEARKLIEEDGSSVVFLSVVGDLHQALLDVAELLDGGKTGKFTQSSQKEIERTLEELIEALQKARSNMQEKDGGGKPGQGGKGALLPPAAELRLLKANQLRVNRRTRAFDGERGEEGALNEMLGRQLQGLSEIQSRILLLARELAQRGHGGPGGGDEELD